MLWWMIEDFWGDSPAVNPNRGKRIFIGFYGQRIFLYVDFIEINVV